MKNKEQNTDYCIVPSTEVFDQNGDKKYNKAVIKETEWFNAVNSSFREITDQKKTYGRYNNNLPGTHPDTKW